MPTPSGPAVPLPGTNFLALLTQVNKDTSTELCITASPASSKDGKYPPLPSMWVTVELGAQSPPGLGPGFLMPP